MSFSSKHKTKERSRTKSISALIGGLTLRRSKRVKDKSKNDKVNDENKKARGEKEVLQQNGKLNDSILETNDVSHEINEKDSFSMSSIAASTPLATTKNHEKSSEVVKQDTSIITVEHQNENKQPTTISNDLIKMQTNSKEMKLNDFDNIEEPTRPETANTERPKLKKMKTIVQSSLPLKSIKLINSNSKTVVLNTFKNSIDLLNSTQNSAASSPLLTRAINKSNNSSSSNLQTDNDIKKFDSNLSLPSSVNTSKTKTLPREDTFTIENRTLTQIQSINNIQTNRSKVLNLKISKATSLPSCHQFRKAASFSATSPSTNIDKKNDNKVTDVANPNLKTKNAEKILKTDQKEEIVNNCKYTLEMFDITITLGTGTFGRVFLAEQKNSANVYAMKIMRMKDIIKLNQIEHVNSEREVLMRSHHPFIVQSYWTYRDQRCLYVLMEYVQGGELFTYLRNEGKFAPSDALFYVTEIISVLGYLHNQSIVYRDLKPENLLVAKDGHLKFTDFGFSKIVQDTTWTLCGTPEYLSPEAIQGKGHDVTCDWWALGILTYELLVGEPPFVDNHPFGLYEKILACEIIWPPFLRDTEPQDFIKRLVVVDRSKRLGKGQNGAEDVKSHHWLRYVNWDDVYQKKLKPPFKPKVAFKGDTSNFDDFNEDWEVKHVHDVTQSERDKFAEWI